MELKELDLRDNSLIDLMIFRILISTELFFNDEFYCRFSGLTDVSKIKFITKKLFFFILL